VSASTSPLPDRAVVFDTVVINYFLAAGEIELLARLFGGSLTVPRVVFDPDEDDAGREEAMSELRRGLHLHRRRCGDEGCPPELRARSEQALPAFEQLPELVERATLRVVDLADEELLVYAQLRDATHVRRYGLLVGLGPGEAAVLALCVGRGWLPATDDNDAVRVAKQLLPRVAPLRIRGLLRLGVGRGVITLEEARAAHETMRNLGFWDTGRL
jgi:predicted nucleic acid-binding protein